MRHARIARRTLMKAPLDRRALNPYPHQEEIIMRSSVRKRLTIAVLAGGLAAAVAVAAFAQAKYTMTVNKDRLLNSQNEPQNWLMMNGDYGSTRYSKLTQINRDNVKSLRLVWALALRGMQDVGQNGPENEVT